jgi:hypothetical protein
VETLRDDRKCKICPRVSPLQRLWGVYLPNPIILCFTAPGGEVKGAHWLLGISLGPDDGGDLGDFSWKPQSHGYKWQCQEPRGGRWQNSVQTPNQVVTFLRSRIHISLCFYLVWGWHWINRSQFIEVRVSMCSVPNTGLVITQSHFTKREHFCRYSVIKWKKNYPCTVSYMLLIGSTVLERI